MNLRPVVFAFLLQFLLLDSWFFHREVNESVFARESQSNTNFHVLTSRHFKPIACVATVEKFLKPTTTRNFDSYNGYIAGRLLICGDVPLNPGPFNLLTFQCRSGLSICHWYIQRLTDPKFGEISESLTRGRRLNCRLDVLILTESFCTSKCQTSLLRYSRLYNSPKGSYRKVWRWYSSLCRRKSMR